MGIRDQAARRIVALVLQGTSVELLGLRGSGRSTILRQVASSLRSTGTELVSINGLGKRFTLEAARIALQLDGGSPSPLPPTQPALVDRLVSRRPAAILVDDGDQLDDASWSVIEAAHVAANIPIVQAAFKRPALLPDDRSLLTFAHPVARVTVEELELDELQDILERKLEGPVAPNLTARVHAKSAGLPGFALSIVSAGVASGRIRRANATWTDEPDLWSPELAAVYDALLHGLDRDARDALEKLAIAGAVRVEDATSMMSQASLELLDDFGLARVFLAGDNPLVAVNPPGLADYFLHQPISARRLRLIDEVAVSNAGHLGLYSRTLYESNGSTTGSARERALISRMFTEHLRLEAREAMHAWEDDPTPAHAVRALSALLARDHDSDAIRRVIAATTPYGTDEDLLRFKYLAARGVIATGGTAHAAIEQLRSPDSFRYRDALTAVSIAIGYELDRIPADYEEQLGAIAAADGLNGAAGRLALSYARVLTGNADRAGELLDDGSPEFPLLRDQLEIARGFVLFASGAYSEASEWASERMGAAVLSQNAAAYAGHSYILAASLASMGRYDEVIDAGHVVLGADLSAATSLFNTDRALFYTLAAVSLRMARNSPAEGLMERAERVPGPSDALPWGNDLIPRASGAVADGRLERGAELYLKTSSELAARGYKLAADQATMAALIAKFDLELAHEFRPTAVRIGGALYGAYLDGKAAAELGDAEGLVRAARILRAERAGDEALRFYLQAVNLFRESGQDERAFQTRSEARELLRSGAIHNQAVGKELGAGLTSRELEIAGYVNAGMSNADIAGKLSVSIRTVETHLRNIRRKTGALDREEIGALSDESF